MKPKEYNLTPAKGQAVLNFQGRLFPQKMSAFEVEELERVRPNQQANTKNLLLQGDCLAACAYLKEQNIEVDLVYIDPPFASGANYVKKIYLRTGGTTAIESDNSIGEEIMYGDIWQKDDYLNWLYERLLAIRTIMSEQASIYVHLDWHIGHYVKILLDEVFGEQNFVNEIVWHYYSGGSNSNKFSNKHDTIFFYSKSEKHLFNSQFEKKYVDNKHEGIEKLKNAKRIWEKDNKGVFTLINMRDTWYIPIINPLAGERVDYITQKPEALLERIIKSSSNKDMVVADFFSGSGTTAKVAHDLGRNFIACDPGVNALQTTRDRLVKAGASFHILQTKEGVRLFRNPAQTKAKFFALLPGFQAASKQGFSSFWDGAIAQGENFIPVKFLALHEKLTEPLLDFYLEEIYKLKTEKVMIVYTQKESAITQESINKKIDQAARSEVVVQLQSLDDLLAEKKDSLFASDSAQIEIAAQNKGYQITIKKFFSPYLKKKLEEYNDKKELGNQNQIINLSETGLELIEAVQFDITGHNQWQSNLDLEDKAGKKDKIKGCYFLSTNKFKMKIRSIAGDELVIDSEEIQKQTQ